MVVNTGSSRNRQLRLVMKLHNAQQQYVSYLEEMLSRPEADHNQTDPKLIQLRDEVIRLAKLAYPDM